MTKKTRRQLLEGQLDDLMSLIVRRRDMACVTCGTTEDITNSHYVTRRKSRLRWDLRNCNAQCRTCHMRHHRWPIAYANYMCRRYSKAVLDELEQLANIPAWHWELHELEDMLEALRNLWYDMSANVLYEEGVKV